MVNVFSLFISLFLVYTAAFGQLPAMQQRSLYLLCAMVILFLVYPRSASTAKKGVAWYDYLFAAASFGCCLYAFVNYEDILLRFGISNSTDQFVFVILAVLILEGTRRLVSPALSLITLIFLVYAYFGNVMPGMFQTKAGGLTRMADHMFMIPEGIRRSGAGLVLHERFVTVHLRSKKLGLNGMPMSSCPASAAMKSRRGHLLIPCRSNLSHYPPVHLYLLRRPWSASFWCCWVSPTEKGNPHVLKQIAAFCGRRRKPLPRCLLRLCGHDHWCDHP